MDAPDATQVAEPTAPLESDEFNLDYTGEVEPEPTPVQNLEPTSEPPVEPTQPEGPVTELDDVESLRQQLAEANLKLLQYSTSQPADSSTYSQPQPQPSPVQAPAPQAPQVNPFPYQSSEVSSVDFLGDVADHVSLLEDRAQFNAMLNKVATVAYNAAVMAAQERILRQIPQVVETTANQQMQIKDIVGRFYTTHKDLEPYKPAVSMAAIKLHNENPNMPLEEMLNKAAEETRRVLRLRPGAGRVRTPAQPGGTGRIGSNRTTGGSNLTEQEQQILDLLS